MVAKVRTVAFHGVEIIEVETRVTIASGLPAVTVAVLPDKAVAESRERVRVALASLVPEPHRCRKYLPIRPILPVISYFPDPESRDFNRLILIPFCLARATRAGGFAKGSAGYPGGRPRGIQPPPPR